MADAYRATTVDDLRALTRDLPTARRLPASRRGRLFPGNRPFSARFETHSPAPKVMAEAMRSIAPDLIAARYRLVQSEQGRLVFRREQYPFATIAAAILIPFVGLIVLLAAGRESSEIVVSANEIPGGNTAVDVFGVASMRVRRAMLELDD